VKVVKVNTMKMPRKPKTFGRYSGYTALRKKAIVTLSEDSKPLEFFEGV
jgi:large subunit ribosomal protein L23